MSLKLPTFYLSYSSQLVWCEQGVWGIGLYFPLPRRSHYCVMATVSANRPVPPISFPSYITASLPGIRELVWVQLRLLSLPLLMLIRQSFEQWGQIGFGNQKCMITLTCWKLGSWWALLSDNGSFPVKANIFNVHCTRIWFTKRACHLQRYNLTFRICCDSEDDKNLSVFFFIFFKIRTYKKKKLSHIIVCWFSWIKDFILWGMDRTSSFSSSEYLSFNAFQ